MLLDVCTIFVGHVGHPHIYAMRALFRTVALGRTLTTTCKRQYSARTTPWIDILLRNPELDTQDARNELRWMRQAIPASADVDAELADMVRRRSEGEPLQYILGDTDFGALTLLARSPVLIPRPETAYIIEEFASRITSASQNRTRFPKLNVLDLCTGSGCIPLLLSHLLGDVMGRAFGVDISPDAISLSTDNIQKVGDKRVSVFKGDVFAPDFVEHVRQHTDGAPIHLITSNPPYIPADEYAALPRSVRVYEDQGALLAGPVDGVADGVAFYQRIAQLAPSLLATSPELDRIPRIAVEIGAQQGEAVSRLLPGRTEVVQDQYGRNRMVLSML